MPQNAEFELKIPVTFTAASDLIGLLHDALVQTERDLREVRDCRELVRQVEMRKASTDLLVTLACGAANAFRDGPLPSAREGARLLSTALVLDARAEILREAVRAGTEVARRRVATMSEVFDYTMGLGGSFVEVRQFSGVDAEGDTREIECDDPIVAYVQPFADANDVRRRLLTADASGAVTPVHPVVVVDDPQGLADGLTRLEVRDSRYFGNDIYVSGWFSKMTDDEQAAYLDMPFPDDAKAGPGLR